MLGTRYEEYEQMRNGLPFVLNANIKRNRANISRETNWHENLEIEFCQKGSGVIILDGEKYSFSEGDIAVVNSNIIHYTGTDNEIIYDALIIGTDFCKQMGFDINSINFEVKVQNPQIKKSFEMLKALYLDLSAPQRIAKLNKLLIEILIELTENFGTQKTNFADKNDAYERVKLAILYIRGSYGRKISLDEISKSVFCDKYTLCKVFKKYTGQTVFENLNNYRCIKAIELLEAGETVASAATHCGFDNLSFFTKTFKKHIGKLPSEYRKKQPQSP